MTFEQFINSLISINPYSILKLFIIIGLLMYIIFSAVVVRQVQLMSGVVGGHGQRWIKIISLVHAVAVVLLFLMALIIL